MALYLWRFAGSPTLSDEPVFDDVPTDAPYAPAVGWALAYGITTGTSDTTYSPATTCTRGQIVTFLYRALAS